MGDFTPFTAKELQPIVVDAVKTTLLCGACFELEELIDYNVLQNWYVNHHKDEEYIDPLELMKHTITTMSTDDIRKHYERTRQQLGYALWESWQYSNEKEKYLIALWSVDNEIWTQRDNLQVMFEKSFSPLKLVIDNEE